MAPHVSTVSCPAGPKAESGVGKEVFHKQDPASMRGGGRSAKRGLAVRYPMRAPR